MPEKTELDSLKYMFMKAATPAGLAFDQLFSFRSNLMSFFFLSTEHEHKFPVFVTFRNFI